MNGIDNEGDEAVDEDPEDAQPLRGASEGWILLYDPDLQKVGEWTIPSLLCVEHNANDGLRTSAEGLQHSVLVRVPVALMDKAGEYRFVISAKDSHADREKGHRNKWALERNQKSPEIQFDLDICDGQNGAAVPDDKEETEGAFTVANLNDTDSNGQRDSGQSPVPGEKDLMRLIVRVGRPGGGGTATLEALQGGAKIRLWNSATKEQQLSLPHSFNIGTQRNQRIEFWLEGVDKSGTLRDVELRMLYKGSGDRVRATLVWAEVTDVKHDTNQTVWADFTDPPQSNFAANSGGGFGLRPISPSIGVRNAIGIQFTVYPPGIGGVSRVQFDGTRQTQGRALRDGHVDISRSFPANDETPNDDSHDQDESNVPNASSHMYTEDPPGLLSHSATGNQLRFFFNFFEFMRVRFDSIRPTGNVENGSRCSPKYSWHVRHTLVNSNGFWTRSTGDAQETTANDIGPGHVTIP